MMLAFGSYYFKPAGRPLPPAGSYTPGIHHNFNGGLRDWVVVTGAPAPGELERHRNGEDPIAIWARIACGATGISPAIRTLRPTWNLICRATAATCPTMMAAVTLRASCRCGLRQPPHRSQHQAQQTSAHSSKATGILANLAGLIAADAVQQDGGEDRRHLDLWSVSPVKP